MPSNTVHRLLDSFFRHPLLNLAPLVLFAALGVGYIATLEPVYRSQGVVLVEDRTMLSSLTDVRGGGSDWQTPAARMTRHLNALLQTDSFVSAIVERSGLADPTALGSGGLQQVRSSIASWEAGENLVAVSSAHEQPEVAHELAAATIESLIQWQIDAEVGQSTAAESFLSPLTEQYRDELAAAQDELEQYLRANPGPIDGDRPATQQVVIDRLMAAVTDANARYQDALSKEESAALATAQTESDVRNRVQLVDEPQLPTGTETSMRSSLMALAAFMAVGTVLSLAAVAGGAMADQTIRFPHDIRQHFDLEVVAVLPDASAWALAPGDST